MSLDLVADVAENEVRLAEIIVCANCGKEFTSKSTCKSYTPKYCGQACFSNRQLSDSTRVKMSDAKKGKSPWNKGVNMWETREHPRGTLGMKFDKQPATEETKRRLSEAHTGLKYPANTGEKHWNWQGGITDPNEHIRKSADYKTWRKAVFTRDNYTCQRCGTHGGELHADHIIPFAVDPSKRFDVENGRVLCAKCHRETDTYGHNINNLAKKQNWISEMA